MSDTSNPENQIAIEANLTGNAAQQAAELSAQIVNLSQHLATLSQRAVQNANVTKAFNQSMGLSASGVSQYSREITQSLNPLGRMTKAVEIQKRVLDQATKSAEAYSAAQRMLNQSSADPMALTRSNAAMSQSVKHMNAMKLSSNDLQKAMKQVALLDYSRRTSENAMKSQQSAYNFFRNFSLPLITGLREAFFSYSKLATESNRTTKLILDNFNKIGAAGDAEGQIKAARAFTERLGKDLDKITRDWGTSRVLIQSLAGDFAELGISSGTVLSNLTRMTAETEKLGNLDISQSSEFIQTMYQTILRIRRETGKSVDINDPTGKIPNEIISQLRGQLAVFNMIENKTVMSLRNIADAFPEVTAAATSFGLSMTEAMSLVIPMIGAGFQVGASANSVKVSLQRMVAMTKQNTQIINQLNAEMGTGFKYSAGVGMENIQMLTDAYRTLSKSVSEGGKGKQGALEFFSRLFGVRQGPRMETAFAQLAAFQTSLETYGSVERTTADILQNSINVELAAIGSKKIAIKQFLDLSEIHRMAIEKDSNDVLTAQALAIQKGQQKAQKLLESANSKNSDFISGMSTEVGKALMAQAFDVNSLAGKQFDAELKLSQDTPEVRYRRAKESLMALGRAVVPVVDLFMKGLLPVLEKLATFLQNNPFVAKLVSALLGLVALSGPLRMIFTTMQTAFGGAVGLFVKLSRVISGTTLQFASLQDLIMNPNLLRGQQRVVQYLDGFLIKSKRGAKELKEAYDFSGISLPAKEAIQAGGIYGSDKAVNMKRMQPFVPQTNQFMDDLKAINAQGAAQSAAQVAAGAESGVTKGAANLSDDIVAQFANAMHRFQGPNLFAGPNYFQNNIPFGGTSGGPGSARTPRAPRGSGGAIADDLTPEETAAAVAANEARKARLRPPTVTTYPKGTLFPTSTAKSFNDLEKTLDRLKKTSGRILFSPANAAAGAAQAASAVARPQAPFNPAQLLSNISQNRIALGRDPLGPVAVQRYLSRAADNVTLSFDQIRSWYVEAGKEITDELEYAFSRGGVFRVSQETLDAVKNRIFQKGPGALFTLGGTDSRLKGGATVTNLSKLSKKVKDELAPIVKAVSDDIAYQVDNGINQSIEALNKLQVSKLFQGEIGKTNLAVSRLMSGREVPIDDLVRAREELFIAMERDGQIIDNEFGALNQYADDMAQMEANVRAKTHRFEVVQRGKKKYLKYIQNPVVESPDQIALREADELARKADVGAADAAAKRAAAEQAAKTRPDYVLNKRIEEARLKVQKLREAKVDALSRVGDYTPPLPTTEPVLVGRLGALDEAIKEQNDEIQKEIKRFKAAKDELNSVISQETDLETTKTGKSRIRAAGKRRMQELQEEHDWELNLLRKQQAKMIADRNRVLNSPAAIQRQIDDTLATLPKDVRAAVQDVDRAISDEMKQLSVRTESRIARMKRALAGIGRADKTTTRAAVPINSMLNAIPSQIKQMGSDGSPLDVFKYKGSRFFNDPRFQQPNARMFDARRGLSLPTSIKSFFGMDRVKPLFQFPKSLSAAFDYTQFTGSDIIMRFADSLEEQLLTVVSTSQTEVKHISEVMRRLASTKTKHKHLPNVLRNFLAATMNIPGMTQDQIESMINLSVNNVVNDVTKTFKGGTAGRDGLKSGTPASLKAFFERLRKKTQGLDGEKMGLQELLFGSSLIKLKEGENFGTSRGITGALQNVVYQSMSGGFVGLGGSFDEGVPKVKKRGINDWWRPLAARKNAAKNAPKGVGKKVVEELADTLNESVDDAIEMVDEIQNEIQEQLVAPVQKAVNNVKPKVNVYKPGELFPGRAPVIAQATAAAGASVTPTPLTLKGLKNTEIELPGTKRQAEKMMESAQRELARQLGIDAKASGASAKIKKLSVANFEKEIERLQGMIAGEQKVLDTLSTPAMRKGPERNLAKLNKQLKELAFARDKYLVAEFALANAAAEVVPTAPSTIAPTGATGATAPTAPPPRVPTPTTPAIPTPAAPSATGGAGKVIDVKKFGQVFKGPNLFHGPNIFDSSLSDLIPNFDELLSPVGEAAEEMADAGAEVAAALSSVLAAGEARKLTGNLVGPGEAGKVSRLSSIKSMLFGKKGVDVPSITAGLDAAQIAKTAGLVDALDAKKLKLKFDDAGALIGMSRIKKLGGEMAISFDRANSILADRLLPNFTRTKKFFSSGIVKGWAFALTGGLSAAVKPAQSLLKALTATGETSIRGKARAAIDNLVESRGPDQKTGIVRKAMAGLSGATGGINSLAAAGSKAADILFKIGTAIAMIGTVAVIALPIIVLMFGIFQAWKSAQGRLGATTEALKQSLTNLKEAISALFAPLRDMVNGFLGADNIGGTFMTQSEKNAAMFYGIATAIKKATEGIKNWAKTTGKAFMSNQVAPFLARLINRFILLGGAIKSAFSGDKEGAMKKFKAFMYSLLYELLNFTKGIVELIGALLKALIPVFVYIAKAGVIVFKAMFQELVRMARDSAFSIGKFLAQSIPSIGIPIKIFDAITGGEEAGDEFSSGFEGSITAGLAGLVDPLKKGLNSALTVGMSGVAKRYAELMGQGINIPLAQRLKNPKAYQEALKYNAKQSADAATAAGESLGSNVANGIKDKMKEIKDTIKGYFYSNVDAKFDSIIQQYTDALNKQKDEQLKAYDDQIAGIDALADAEERLTAKKDYETKRREMIDQRETDRSNYLVERRLAVYEGRAFDVRKLDREEVLAQRNSSKEIQELDSGRLSQLQSEQRDLAKQAISNQKDLAEKQFQEVLDTFDRFIEDVKNKSFATQEEFAAALAGVGEQANLSSAELARVFAANIGELPRIIAGVRDPSINMFNTNMDDLIREASKKFGLDANVANPATLLGAVRMMAIGSEEGFKAAFNPAFAVAYVQPAITAIAKITSSLSEKGNKNNIAEIWQKAGEDAFAKLRAELNRDIAFPKILDSFKKLLDDLKPLIAQIVALAGEANSSLGGIGDDIVAGASFTAEDRNNLSQFLLQFAPTDAGRRGGDLALNSPSLQRVVGLIMRDYDKGNQYMLSNINNYGLTGLERVLMQGYLTNQQLGSGTPSLLRPLPGTIIRSYNGGHIRQFVRGGFLDAPSSVGIPALLHGGEYIINHKAVEKFGKGNLARINALKNGGDFKGFASGGYMTTPGFANGGYMTTPGFAKGGIVPDRFEAKQKLSSQIANAERAKILAKNKLPTNFIGPVAEPKEKSWWQKPLPIVKEILRPKNSFAIAGALLAGFLGAPSGPGAVGTAVAGAAIGGGIGEWVEQLFDKKKGIQPLDIAKNAAMQGIFQLAGIGVGKVVAKFAKPALKSVKPALMDKFPGVGSYLEGKLVRPWLNPLKNIFKKPGIDSFDSSVLNPSNIVDVGPRGLPAPPRRLALGAGSPMDDSMRPVLEKINGAILLGRSTVRMPTASVDNILMHGGPSELLGGVINPEFIRGGYPYAALKGLHPLAISEPSLIKEGTERLQTAAVLSTYEQMLDVIRNIGKYESTQLVPNMVTPGYRANTGVPGGKLVAWGEQVEIAKNWVNQHKAIVALKLQGAPHSTGVSPFKNFGASAYDYGADRSAHLVEIPDNLLPESFFSSFGDSGPGSFGERPFFGTHKPFAAVTSEDAARFATGTNYNDGTYLAAAIEIANYLNNKLSKEALATFHQSMMVGNQITPGARGVILQQLKDISWNALNYSDIEQRMAAAMNVDEMLSIVKSATVDPERNANKFKESKDYLLSLIKTVGDPSITPLVKPIVARSDEEIIAGIMESRQFQYLESWQKERFLKVIKDAMAGKSVSAKLISDSVGYSLFRQPNPYDVMGALRSGLPINDLIAQVFNADNIPKYKTGGYVPGAPSKGIPALLHGGEYIINHKAVEKFGKGNLERVNSLKNGGNFKGFASGGYMTTPGFANGGYMKAPGFGFGGFFSPDQWKFNLGGKGPGGPWGGLVTGMRNAVVGAGSKAVRFVDTILTGGALTDLSRSIGESAKGNNKEAAKLAATGVAKGAFQMFAGKILGPVFKVASKPVKAVAKFGGAYFLEKAGLGGMGITAKQAVRLGIGAATRNALEREAVAIAGSRVATGFGDNYLNTLIKEISGEATHFGTAQGIGDPATGLMGNVLRADNIAIREAKRQANSAAYDAAQARGMSLTQAGGYPYPSGSYQSRGPITKIVDFISNLNPFQQRIGIHVGRPGSAEILPNQIATGPSDTIKGFIYSWLKGSPEIIADDAKNFAGLQGFLDPSLTRLGAESVDEAVRPGSYYITKAKGAILRDANVVNSPARASNWAQVLRELPITSTKEELEAALAQSRGNSGVKGVFNTIKNKTRALINSIKSPFKKKPVSTKGGALVPYNSSIKTYKAGTGILSEVPNYISPEGLKLEQLGLYVHKIGNEHVVFGGMSKPLRGLAKKNPGLNIKSIGLNPYEISGLNPGTAEGDALANQWIRARFGHIGMGNSVDDTYVSALLYDWKKNNNFFSMLKFKQYEMLGSAKVENLRIERKANPADILHDLMLGGKEKILPEHLFLTHETKYPIKIDEAGNAILHPMSAFDTTSGTRLRGPYSGGPFNMGENAEFFRDSLHFALNHQVVGHGQRQNVKEGYLLIAEAMEAFKANPNAVDSAYTVDTFLTPPPGQPLRFPKGSYKIVKLGKDAKESPHTAMQEMISKLTGITKPVDEFGFTSFDEMNAHRDAINQYFLQGGDHGAGDFASQAVGRQLADMLGVPSISHFDQFMMSDILHLKKGANQPLRSYISLGEYMKAGENHWSRLLARDPFVQDFTLPYDNPKLAEKITRFIEQFTELGYSYPTGRPYNNRAYNGGYIPKFKKGGYLKFKEGGEVPSILHGGEYVLNAAAVKKYGLAHLEAMNQMRFKVPSAGFSVPQSAYSGSMAGGMTTSTQNVNIYVDNFIGEPEWFNSMMKDYNTKILPKNQKALVLKIV
jgi:hypothetical protein